MSVDKAALVDGSQPIDDRGLRTQNGGIKLVKIFILTLWYLRSSPPIHAQAPLAA